NHFIDARQAHLYQCCSFGCRSAAERQHSTEASGRTSSKPACSWRTLPEQTQQPGLQLYPAFSFSHLRYPCIYMDTLVGYSPGPGHHPANHITAHSSQRHSSDYHCGIVNVMPFLFSEIYHNRTQVLWFRRAVLGGLATCTILNILWCWAVVEIVPQMAFEPVLEERLLNTTLVRMETTQPAHTFIYSNISLEESEKAGEIATIPLTK
ncbi:hypothetical protein PHYPO_G00026780, partial [Pangasianodon hypophthalmus]